MSRRTRSKTVDKRPKIDEPESEEEVETVESDDDYADDSAKSKGSKQRRASRSSRMNVDGEEMFLQLIIRHFDAIENKATIRGIPSYSAHSKQRKQQEDDAWTAITNDMNERSGVSIFVNCFRFVPFA